MRARAVCRSFIAAGFSVPTLPHARAARIPGLVMCLAIGGMSLRPATAQAADSTGFEPASFRTPPSTYRAVPFHSLNDLLDPAELDRQLRAFKEGGFGGVFLHTRSGLLTPYLGEAWFTSVAAAVKTSQEIGCDAWFYDEDRWPSGFAGGIVPRQDPAFRARCLVRVTKDTPVIAPDTLLFEDASYRYVCHVAPLGEAWFNGASWVDLINPATVKAFLDSSYAPYVQKFGGQAHAPGIFTDEPQINTGHVTGAVGGVSFSPVVAAAFKARTGRELAPLLPALFAEVGEWRTVRLEYYRTLADCFERSYSKQIGDYCAAHGLTWTGHYNGEESPTANMLGAGNMMLQYRHMQMPGIDALGLGYYAPHNAKVMTSVANQYDQPRRLSELFGVSGQNLNFEDRLWLTAWHTLMGVNFLCPHLAHYSLKGERKRDCPPTISPHQPYWPYNRICEDYSARLCYFATAGRSEAEVCVLHPIESVYIEHASNRSDKYDGAIDTLLTALLRAHRNFDLGDEQILSEIGKVENGRFVIGAMAYRAVVVPPMLTIRPATLMLLERFAAQGGTVLVAGSYPELIDGRANPDAVSRLKAISQLVPAAGCERALNTSTPPVFTLSGTKADSVWTHLRAVRGGHALQLSNTSRRDSRTLTLRLADARAAVALWNPLTGQCLRLQPAADGAYALAFAPTQTWIVTFGEVAQDMRFDGDDAIPGDRREVIKLDGPWQGRRADPNALILDYARFSTDEGATWSEPEPVLAIHDRFALGTPYHGKLLLKYAADIRDLPVSCRLVVEQPEMYFSIKINGQQVSFAGSASYLDASFRSQDITGLLTAGSNEVVLGLDYISAIPTSPDARARCGTEIESVYLTGDFALKAVPADHPLPTTERNQTGLVTKPVHSFKRFSLVAESRAFDGDLVPQGYPFYAGAFQLTRSFDLAALAAGHTYRIAFPASEAVVIQVEVNGRPCPPLVASPWEVDVTAALQPGRNRVRVSVINSLRNLLGPHHHKGGELTAVGPASFRGNHDWPNSEPGEADWYDARRGGHAKLWRDDYYLIPFGLLQPPLLVQLFPTKPTQP